MAQRKASPHDKCLRQATLLFFQNSRRPWWGRWELPSKLLTSLSITPLMYCR